MLGPGVIMVSNIRPWPDPYVPNFCANVPIKPALVAPSLVLKALGVHTTILENNLCVNMAISPAGQGAGREEGLSSFIFVSPCTPQSLTHKGRSINVC